MCGAPVAVLMTPSYAPMPQTHLLVIDLETVPDADILPPEQDPEAFPKPVQHRIVTLGFPAGPHPPGWPA